MAKRFKDAERHSKGSSVRHKELVREGYEEKSGQLIECVNPEHLMLGAIHYKQDSCAGKSKPSLRQRRGSWVVSVPSGLGINESVEVYLATRWKTGLDKLWEIIKKNSRFDSDESWQASEALLKR